MHFKNIDRFLCVCFLLSQNTEGNANVEMALRNPTLYVLKPQREGGGKLLLLLLLLLDSFNILIFEVTNAIGIKGFLLYS